MQKSIKIILLSLSLLISGFVSFAQNTVVETPPTVETPKMRKVFYGMRFHELFVPGRIVDINSMPADTPVFIMFYKTDCGHCVLDAKRLNGLVQQYEIPFWMISHGDVAGMENFVKQNKLTEIPNIRLLDDFDKQIHVWFDFKYVPFFALIDKKGNFIKEFDVLPTPEELKEIIRTNEYLDMYQNEGK